MVTLAAVQAMGVASVAAGEKREIVTLDTRSSVTLDFLLIEPEKPIASVILFEGGDGDLRFSGTKVGSKGFLAASRDKFAARGFIVALVDAPSDKKGHGGMPGGFRSTGAHVKDIDSVVAWLKRKYALPVWFIGVSRGTQSAAYVAIHGNAGIGGLVLTSSMVKVTDKSMPIPSMNLDKITVPTLLVAHKRDGCKYTPPKGAEEIKAGLTNAAKVEVRYFEGGRVAGKDPCKPPSHHTFYGIEDEVVAAIADFIRANPVALK
jgi:pimeloyl-ACP methyl ester carboxylesterase